MMMICAEMPAVDENQRAFKKRALRNAIICIGWLKLMSVIVYTSLFFLVHINSIGTMSTVIQVMTLTTVPFQIINGLLLFFGALESRVAALEMSLWLCLIMASYNTVLGIMGAIYFIRTGNVTLHFMLAVAFTMLAFSLSSVICHDILIVYAYKQLITEPQDNDNNTSTEPISS